VNRIVWWFGGKRAYESKAGIDMLTQD
jgi:hypothetical protein